MLDTLMEEHPGLGEWSILVGYRGSLAHGTYRPPSEPTSIDDKDLMAICVPTIDHYFGLREFGSRGTQEIKQGEWDIVIYESRKFIRLLTQGNPNVLMMLWLRPEDYVKLTDAGHLLLTHRHLFAVRHVYHSFVGYAHAQLHRMQSHVHQGYMGEKRKALVERFGYDTKNASHLIRLLRMVTEFLKTGEMQVWRPDADELVAIKRGEWTLEQVKAEAERGFKLAEAAYLDSPLPDQVDSELVDSLAVRVASIGITG